LKRISFDEIEVVEVGNGISFVGTIWLDSQKEQFYILPCTEDLAVELDNIACFEFNDRDKYRWINQAWLLESRRYTGFKEQAVRVSLYRSQSSIDPAIKWKVFRRDNFICQYCGWDSGEMTYDHIVPISLGGSTTVENGNTACRPCNKAKCDLPIEEWMQSDKLKRLRNRKSRS
jgi:hypothetical protein